MSKRKWAGHKIENQNIGHMAKRGTNNKVDLGWQNFKLDISNEGEINEKTVYKKKKKEWSTKNDQNYHRMESK